jgi:hypothetical protein
MFVPAGGLMVDVVKVRTKHIMGAGQIYVTGELRTVMAV